MSKKDFYVKESLKLFMKYGIKSVTVGQITTRLNVSSKTLYSLFGDKSGLVNACFALYKANSLQEYTLLESHSGNVADMLIRFYNRSVESLSRINPNFFNDISNYFPEIWDSDEAFGLSHTRAILEKGITEGIFVDGLNVEICTITVTMLLRSMFEKDALWDAGTQKLLNNVLWPYVRGICTQKGLEEFRKYRKQALVV